MLFNRDERHSRGAESPPTVRTGASGTRYAAPSDGDRLGTWLMVNEHGVTVAVLNWYPRMIVETGRTTRGRLPLACVACSTSADAVDVIEELLQDTPSGAFAPFVFVAVDREGDSRTFRWDGIAGTVESTPAFLTSSSFRPAQIEIARLDAYERWMCSPAARMDRDARETFHWTHAPSDGAVSVLMRRADAATRSVCAVSVGSTSRLTYTPVVWPEGTRGESVSVLV